MTDTPEIARIRAALDAFNHLDTDAGRTLSFERNYNIRMEFSSACKLAAITAVLAHIDAQSAEIVRLNKIISDCRDAAPTPAPWSEAESEWSAAMSFAEGVPGFLKASFDVMDREIERQSERHAQELAAYALTVSNLRAQLAVRGGPVAWVRFCSDGAYEGPIMDSQMEDVRKKSGAWTPLYTAPQPAAQPEQKGQDEFCTDYHCAGDCRMRGFGYQHTTAPQPAAQPERKPIAWARQWFIDGIKPAKERNANGRLAWPVRFKFLPVTAGQCLPDDVPLFAQDAP